MVDATNIDILLTMDSFDELLLRHLSKLIEKVGKDMPWINFRIHELTKQTIHRCLGCKTCPPDQGKPLEEGRCAIRDPEDYIEQLRGMLLESDGIIVAGVNLLDAERVIFRYQVATERMRYIRRMNFPLTDKLFTGLSYNQYGATMNGIHSIKTLTSYIRQNTTFFKPIDIFEHQGQLLGDGAYELANFCRSARRMKSGKKLVPAPDRTYVTGGIAGGYAS